MAYGNFAIGGMNMAQAMAGQQGGHLAGMANQAMGAIQRENDSRVAQHREHRQRQHEKDMLNMSMASDARIKELEAMIARLQKANEDSKSQVVFL